MKLASQHYQTLSLPYQDHLSGSSGRGFYSLVYDAFKPVTAPGSGMLTPNKVD